MKKLLLSVIALLCVTLHGHAQARSAQDILGARWTNEAKTGQVEFYTQEGKYFARLHLLKNTGAKDAKNQDKGLRSRPLEGLTIISGLSYAGGQYAGGTVYSPERGQTVNCKIEWVDDKTIALTGSKGFLSKTERWTRE